MHTNFLVMDNVDQSHGLTFVANENLVANINLSLDLDGVSRNLNLDGERCAVWGRIPATKSPVIRPPRSG